MSDQQDHAAHEAVQRATASAPAAVEAAVSSLPHAPIPEAVRATAERGVSQARTAYDSLRTNAEQAMDAVEKSYSVATRDVQELSLTLIETARQQANAGLDLASELLSVRTPAEAIELQAAFMRRQFEALTAQGRAFGAVTNKLLAEGAKPYGVLAERLASVTRV